MMFAKTNAYFGGRIGAFVAAALALGLAGTVPARAGEPIEREAIGNVAIFHQAVCAREIGPGVARCHAHIRTDAAGNPLSGKRDTARNSTPSGFGPNDLRSAYAITVSGSSSTTVAIVDAYGYSKAASDLAVYRAQYGLPPCTAASGCFTQINGTGGTTLPTYNSGWAQEQALDLAMVSAMCPNCKILLIEAASSSYSALGQAVATAVAHGAKVVSNSYGGGESGTSSYASYYSHAGIAITASAGDSGYGAQFPATAPGTIAVGGTSLSRNSNVARGWSEVVWTGTGSGCSAVFAKPSWQNDSLCTTRMETDISAIADPATGVAVYGPTGFGTQSGWLVFGGTSVAAPLIGGIYGATGAAPTAAQKIWAEGNAGAGLNDITSGSNATSKNGCGGTYFCTAQKGYDGPSGWGTPAGTAAF